MVTKVDLAITEAEAGSGGSRSFRAILGRGRHDQLPDHWPASKHNHPLAEILYELTTRWSDMATVAGQRNVGKQKSRRRAQARRHAGKRERL